jgi:hypothetical protein
MEILMKKTQGLVCLAFTFNMMAHSTYTNLAITLEARTLCNGKQSFSAPQNVSPAPNVKFTQAALSAPLIFKWKPVTPVQEAPITYRLKIWQLSVGQNYAQAIKNNKPLITKDLKFASQTVIANLISGPCKAPYRCEFVWTVQALSSYTNVTSKPTTFSANSSAFINKNSTND